MARIIALVAAPQVETTVRSFIVVGCALALILAGQVLAVN